MVITNRALSMITTDSTTDADSILSHWRQSRAITTLPSVCPSST
jgi:hypothetical protein